MVESFYEPSKEILSSPLVVAEIVTRWHAMKVLFDLYCEMTVRSSYLSEWATSRDCSPETDDENETARPSTTDICDSLAQRARDCSPQTDGESETARPSTKGICDSFAQLSLQEKQRAYERYYRALTAHWVAEELTWMMRVSKHKTERDFRRWERKLYNRFSNNPQRSLEEKLDIFETVDFVWNFLMSKIFDFYAGSLADWMEVAPESATPNGFSPLELYVSHRGELRQPSHLEPTFHEEREDIFKGMFIDDLGSIISPPYVIERLLQLVWDPKSRYDFDRREYVRKLGFFDQSYEWEQTKEDGFRIYRGVVYDIEYSDEDILSSLSARTLGYQEGELWHRMAAKYESLGSTIDEMKLDVCWRQWARYKEDFWNTEMRGEIFFRQRTETQLFERFMELEEEPSAFLSEL
jgi:hypothetical protein